MREVLPVATILVPVVIELLTLFVVIAAGATIALLSWRASRGKLNYPHP